MQAEVELKSVFGAIGLEGLEHVQGSAPFGGDLGKGEVGAAQLGSKRVHPHEDFGDLVVREGALQHIHPVDVFTDILEAVEPLRVNLRARIIQTCDTSSLEEGIVVMRSGKHLAHLHPLG